MKKKLLSLFALLCLILPACIGLVGCGTQSDTQAIISACDQISTIFSDMGTAMYWAEQKSEPEINNTYISFEDFASINGVWNVADFCYQISSSFALIKGAYSKDSLKESVKSNNLKFNVAPGNAENGDYLVSFSFKNTIDRNQKKITCIFGYYDDIDLKIDINYDFGKGQVLSFELFIPKMPVENSNIIGAHSIKYDKDSALTIASASVSTYYNATQTEELNTIIVAGLQWEAENEEWNSESTLVGDYNGDLFDYFAEIDSTIFYKAIQGGGGFQPIWYYLSRQY